MSSSHQPPTLTAGAVHAFFAYDVAPAIDLRLCEQHLGAAERLSLRAKQRGLEYFATRPAPLRALLDAEAVSVGGFETESLLELVLYDFGAVSVNYRLAVRGPFTSLLSLSQALYGQEALRVHSRSQVERLLPMLRQAAPAPLEITGVGEDYFVFHLESFEADLRPEELYTRFGAATAQLLRAEAQPLSEQEVADAIGARIGFGVNDLAIIDWNSAILLGADIEDLRTVLEFANVELAEVRFLDRQLDDALERSYALVSRQRPSWLGRFRSPRTDLRRIAELQVDAAILFERVTNAVKLFGEEYLTRVYRLAAGRFRLDGWNATILRKLETLESIYEKMSDQAAARRMELLEWIIVILIAVSIVLSLR